MTEITSEKDNSLFNQRKIRMQQIRNSLQHFSLISKNKTMVEKKLGMQCDSLSESESTDGLSLEAQDGLMRSNFQHAELFAEKYETVGKLGEGSDGVVHKCIKKKTGRHYAAKAIMFEDEHVLQLRQNFLLMKGLSHHNIVSYEALYLDLKKHSCWLVMELCDMPSLIRTPLANQSQLKDAIQQLLETLNYLHQRSVTHRDVKPQNMLYSPQTKKFKLIDFGICRKHKRRGIRMDMLTITGTLYYRAPEMFSGGGYNEKVDIWGAGATIYKLVTGRTPFESEYHRKTIKKILNDEVYFPEAFSNYSPALQTLITKMLKKDPKERITAQECLKEAWFTSSKPTMSNQVNLFEENCENEMECIKSPFLDTMDDSRISIRTINGNEYHCYDSDDEDRKNQINLKKSKNVMEVQLNSFRL